jgi:hypothetical protein
MMAQADRGDVQVPLAAGPATARCVMSAGGGLRSQPLVSWISVTPVPLI